MNEETHTEPESEPEPAGMPGWVPVVIGGILVALAALAVVTGLRYRDQTLVRMVPPRSEAPPRANSPSPPGEPEAGASRMFPGDAGANVPSANEAVEGPSRAEITGGPEGVTGVIKLWVRRGMRVQARPQDAMIYVNDVAVGQASQFDSQDEIYDFAAPGSYTVRVVALGYVERRYIVTADPEANSEIARIEATLDKEPAK